MEEIRNEQEKEVIIPQEQLLEELYEFKLWSGKFLVRLFSKEDGEIKALGSGGLLKYKDKYFILTNAHVIKNVKNIKENLMVPYTIEERSYMLTILDYKMDVMEDIAVLEIKFDEKILLSNHTYLDEDYVDTNISEYESRCNIVFLHGYPSGETVIDHEKREIDATTLPYCTFIDKYDKFIGTLFVDWNETGVSEFKEEITLPVIAGMSGSFAYGYYFQETRKFKLIGILSNWHITEKKLEIFPIIEFIKYIEANFNL